MPGGQSTSVSDSDGERKGTWLLFIFLFSMGGILFLIYRPSLDSFTEFMQENWHWIAVFLVVILLAYRAFQGVGLFPNLRSLSISGGSSGGGSGGSGSGGGIITLFRWILRITLFCLVAFIFLYVAKLFDASWAETAYDWNIWFWNWW